MFCRAYVTQLREHIEEFESRGVKVVAIGMGWPEMAADFKKEYKIPFPLIVDQEQLSYRTFGLESNWMKALGPGVWIRGIRNALRGHTSKPTKLDMSQLGGVGIVDSGGRLVFQHRADDASDNPPIETLLAALP